MSSITPLIIGALVVALIAIIVYIINTHNKFAKSLIRIDEAFATIDVYCKKRWDLIPNLVETVKGYTKHENEVLTKVTELRQNSINAKSKEEKMQYENEISTNISAFLATAEAYPVLAASQNFADLSQALTQCEQDLSNARRYYNATIKEYNNLVMMFPSSIVASICKHEKMAMFNIDETERQNVSIKF